MTLLRWTVASCVMTLGLGLPPSMAEVAFFGGRTLIAGMTDGSDPIAHRMWRSVTSLPLQSKLNLGGDERNDGRPDVIWDPTTGWPIVAWAYNTGSDHDIAVATWTGSAWSSIEFATWNSDDEVDPRVFLEADGTLRVAYWVRVKEEVLIAKRTPSGQWRTPIQIGEGRRPSIANVSGLLRVAYETPADGVNRFSLALYVEEADDEAFESEIVEETTRTGSLDPIIHVTAGRAWLDYKRADDEIAVLIFAPANGDGIPGSRGAWRSLEPEPCLDPSWIGVEGARRDIQRRVLDP